MQYVVLKGHQSRKSRSFNQFVELLPAAPLFSGHICPFRVV